MSTLFPNTCISNQSLTSFAYARTAVSTTFSRAFALARKTGAVYCRMMGG